jgi:hypothetical protein
MAKTPTPAPEQPAEQDPPAGGRWIRQPDGSLTPHPTTFRRPSRRPRSKPCPAIPATP